MSDIFLSYASEDRPWVRSLVSTLERQGWSVWWDRTILPGKTFDQAIQEALDTAKCMIVVWSVASVESDWVKAEAAEGVRRRILVPVLIDDVRLPLEFRRIQAAHLLDWHDTEPHPEFDKVVQAVTHLVGFQKQLERTEAEAEAFAKPLRNMIKPRDEEPLIPMLALSAEPQAVTEIPILPDITPDKVSEEVEIALEPAPEASQLALQPTPADSVITFLYTDMEDKAGVEFTPEPYDTQSQDEEDKSAYCPVTMSDTDVALDLALDEIPVASMQKDGKVEIFQKDERQQRLDHYETTPPTVGEEPSLTLADNSHENAGRKTPIEVLPIVESSSSLDATTLLTPRILEVALAAGVKDRNPERILSTQDFCSEWGNVQAPRIDLTKHRQIFLWNRVKSVVKQELLHTYYTTSKRDTQDTWWQKVDTVTLGIDSSESWRTWSNKKNLRLGAWKVEITTASAPRDVLCTVYFDVVKTAERKRGGLLSLFRH